EEYLEPSLQGFRLTGGRYEPVPWEDGGVFSEVLGLRLERDDADLRFFDPAKGRRVPTGDELGEAAQQLENRLEESENENERLRRELEALRRRLNEGLK